MDSKHMNCCPEDADDYWCHTTIEVWRFELLKYFCSICQIWTEDPNELRVAGKELKASGGTSGGCSAP